MFLFPMHQVTPRITLGDAQVLEHWKAEGHRSLLFCQTQQMLDILERCTAAKGLKYHRMDGSTPVARCSRA